MIYLRLLLEFLKIGLFTFGGGYGSIPLIRDAVLSNEWLSEDTFAYFLAVSESTPGPIMINMATYIGSSQGGFWGSVLATLGVVLPSFILILLIASILKHFINNQYVQAVLGGIKPGIVGLILATGIYMLAKALGLLEGTAKFSWQSVVIAIVLVAAMLLWKKLRKKQLSPIYMILIAAALGIFLY